MFRNFDQLDDSLFWFCALAGSGLFVFQFLLTFLGALDSEGDATGDFKWLSKQAMIGFLMMFGWVGLTCKKEFDFRNIEASLIASIGGFIAMFITGCIFKLAGRLRNSGTIFRIDDAIGKQGITYQQIPKNGVGKISVSLQGFTHEIDAISLGEPIPSFTAVQIIKKADDKTLVVVPTK